MVGRERVKDDVWKVKQWSGGGGNKAIKSRFLRGLHLLRTWDFGAVGLQTMSRG